MATDADHPEGTWLPEPAECGDVTLHEYAHESSVIRCHAEPRTGSLVGPMAVRAAQEFLYDIFVCSGAAVDAGVGSSEASLAESEVKRAFSQTSSRIILAVDRSKLGTRAQARMFQLVEVDLMVTDLDPGDSRLDAYRRSVELA